MVNLKRTRSAQVCVALPVTAGLIAGKFIKFGSSTLRGLLLTERATTATIADGTSAPGLKDGEATVELIGVHTTIKWAVTGATAQFTPVYFDSNGDLTTTATSNTLAGVTISSTVGVGEVEVALF